MGEQDQSIAGQIMGNIPQVLGVISMFIIASLYFQSPAWGPALVLRNAVTLAMPFPAAIVTVMLVRKHVNNVRRGDDTLPYDIIVIAGVVVMTILGSTSGVSNVTLKLLNENINIIGTMSITSAIAISVFSPMIRIYRAKTPTMAFLIVLSIIAYATFTPLGQMIHPIIPAMGNFIQSYVVGASDSAFWISTYIGAMALVTKMILLKEKMSPS